MDVPNTYTDKNETGCCPVPDVNGWDEKEIEFKGKHFIRRYGRSFLFVPINMGKIMTWLQSTAEKAEATMPIKQAMILSRDISPWKSEQLYMVSKAIEGADNVVLDGTFLTKVFEGPYKDAKKWYDSVLEFAKRRGKKADRVYFFYTTCPKCAKHYGKNYVIGLADVSA